MTPSKMVQFFQAWFRLFSGRLRLMCSRRLLPLVTSAFVQIQPPALEVEPTLSRDARRSLGPIIFALGQLGQGGTERQAFITAKALVCEFDLDLRVVAGQGLAGKRGFYEKDFASIFVPVDQVPSWPRWDHEIPIEFRNTAVGIEISRYLSIFRKEQPRVVHAWLDLPNVAAGMAALISGVPRIVLSTRSLSPEFIAYNYRLYLRDAYRHLLSFPHVSILNNSRAGTLDYARWLGIGESRIFTLPNGFLFDHLNADVVRPSSNILRRANGRPIVGTVMRLSREKRPDLWIEIAKELLSMSPNYFFVIVGSGPLHKFCARILNQGSLSENVLLLSSTVDAYSAMASFDLFLMTSEVEGLPNTLIEAQALGVPVITTPAGGAPETLRVGETGWVFHRSTPHLMAKQVHNLFCQRELLAKAHKVAPEWAKDSFSIDRVAKELQQIYFH